MNVSGIYDEVRVRIRPCDGTVTIEEHQNGVVTVKQILPDDLIKCLGKSVKESKIIHSGFLPENCVSYAVNDAHKIVTLVCSEHYARITYHETLYDHFPLPSMVFSFAVDTNGAVTSPRLGVMAQGRVKPDTPMYHYPFSNVSSSHICTGSTPLPKYKELRTIATLPNYIMGIPNNDDNYSDLRNMLKLGYRDLLEHLKDKEPDYYYGNILVPNGHTLQDFIDRRY